MAEPFGASAPAGIDRAVIALTGQLPDNWLGLRLAIGLRRIVTMRMAGDDGFDVTCWGFKLRLHPLRNGCEKGALFTPQMYEVPERQELFADIDRALAEGRTFSFVDIGANVGLFSFLVASRAGSRASILAVEPDPENLRRLRFNIAANPGVPIRVVATALGEAEGTLVLQPNLSDRGGTRTRAAKGGEPETATRVACRPLLQVLQERGIRTIDAEGAEDKILIPFFRDAEHSLWPRLILIEDTSAEWDKDLFAVLAQAGYAVSRRTKLNVILRRAA